MITISALYIFSIFVLSFVTNLSRKSFSTLFYQIFHSRNLGIGIYSIIYFPGTVIHEISHFLFAAFLGVRTGNINLFPKRDEDENRIQLGSVQVAKTDFVRSSLIGAAPFITGSILLIYLISVLGWTETKNASEIFNSILNSIHQPIFWARVYGILAISNTLFTSREDRRHWPVLIVMIVLIVGVLYIANARISLNDATQDKIHTLLLSGFLAFIFSTSVNLVLISIFKTLSTIIEKITKTKVVYK